MLEQAISSIIRQQRSIGIQAVTATALFVGILAMLLGYQGTTLTMGLIMTGAALVIVNLIFVIILVSIPSYVGREAAKLTEPAAPKASAHQTASPWEMQHKLMEASGQWLPNRPTLTNGTLLYGALIMEEVAETFQAIVKVMGAYADSEDSAVDIECSRVNLPDFIIIRNHYYDNAMMLLAASKAIRGCLANQTYLWDIPRDLAEELLDGTTDITVVNCGFALATGLPGEMAYDEVAISNLSKRNPDTGIIDKTPDGKWIKGRDYRPPNLAPVLAQQHLANSWKSRA